MLTRMSLQPTNIFSKVQRLLSKANCL